MQTCLFCELNLRVKDRSLQKSIFRPISRLKLKMKTFHELAALTLPVVIRGIDHVLEDDPEHPYHLAFAMPELRQKLIDHILNNVPNHYAVKIRNCPLVVTTV